MSTQVTPDVDTLRREVQEKYTEVAQHPERTFHFHHGRPLAKILAYPMDKVDAMSPDAVESFAGVGNPFSLGPVLAGQTIVDVGSGGGFDSLIAAEMVGPVPFPAINAAFDGLFPKGLRQYWKGNYVKELTDDAIAVHVEHGPNAPTMSSTMHLYPIDGAPHRVSQDSTAFGHRDANWAMVILAGGAEPASDESNIRWVRDYSDAITPYSQAGGYVNFMSADDSSRTQANYGANYDRLADVKRRYDPDNLFHVNQNINT